MGSFLLGVLAFIIIIFILFLGLSLSGFMVAGPVVFGKHVKNVPEEYRWQFRRRWYLTTGIVFGVGMFIHNKIMYMPFDFYDFISVVLFWPLGIFIAVITADIGGMIFMLVAAAASFLISEFYAATYPNRAGSP